MAKICIVIQKNLASVKAFLEGIAIAIIDKNNDEWSVNDKEVNTNFDYGLG